MNRAQPKSSPTDQQARSIAAAIAKGRPPALTPELDRYFESSPRDIFVAFEGVARHMPPGGHDETLALGHLFLLQQLLERLRYRTDRGYADAARLIADFQANVAARVEAGQIDGHMLAYVGGALHQSKIPASPELASSAGTSAGTGARGRGRSGDEESGGRVGSREASFGSAALICPTKESGGWLSTLRRHSAQGRWPAESAVASSRKNSSV